MTQEDFARRIGVSTRTYQRYENLEKRPAGANLEKVRAGIAWAEAELDKRAAADDQPHVAAKASERPTGGGLSANTMRILEMDHGGRGPAPEMVLNDQLLLEFSAWTRRMIMEDPARQKIIADRLRAFINEIEAGFNGPGKNESTADPPGRARPVSHKQGGGEG